MVDTKDAVRRRVTSLDGLRGLAATIVVLRHSFNALSIPVAVRHSVLESPLAVLLNGQGAVQIFFVLSGYVLASSLRRMRNRREVLRFYVRRIFRIHPPYVVAILCAWLASFFYVAPPIGHGLTAWLHSHAAVHIDPYRLAKSMLFPGRAFGQLPVGWTLEVEMLFSLAMPALVLFARRIHWLPLVGGAACLLLADIRPIKWMYAIDFCLGIAGFMERERLARALRQIPLGISLAFVVAFLALFVAPLILGWSVEMREIVAEPRNARSIAVMGVGSLGLIIASVHVPQIAKALSAGPVRYLGKISFSLYLVHEPVLILCTRLVSTSVSWVGAIGFIVLVVGVATLVSDVYYRLVESPSIRAGNAACKRLGLLENTGK